jgi:threonine/homoserine/homoserine lactone efflux protein
MLSNSLSNGFCKSTATAAGDLSANLLQMIAASAGLASLLMNSQAYFFYIKWAGVAYLVYLGVKQLLAEHSSISNQGVRSVKSLYWQGFITSAANPKAVVFFAALFPHFLDLAQPLMPQFIALSLTYLIVDGLFLCFYGKAAEFFKRRYLRFFERYIAKVTGGLFIGAAVLLGIKSIDIK